jgi:hypothetical protein
MNELDLQCIDEELRRAPTALERAEKIARRYGADAEIGEIPGRIAALRGRRQPGTSA